MSTRTSRRLPLQLDHGSHQPAYLQIVQHIDQWARNGRLQPADRLPTVRLLAAQLGLNFNTVARAYRLLQRLRVVSPQRGRGTFVVGPASTSALERVHRQTLQSLADQFLAQARLQRFSDAEIAGMIRKRLRSRSRRR